MKLDPIRAKLLSMKLISNVTGDMIKSLELKPHQKSIGLFTTDIDDIGHTALDDATKKADVEVVYAKSMYAGSANASTKLAGEFIGILAGPNPAEVRSGLHAVADFIENGSSFFNANDEGDIPFYSYNISRTGTYLSQLAGIPEGEPLAYLIAPPLESIYGLDAAMKAADVKMVAFFGPPSETNFGGGLLTGSQSATRAACDAFASAVMSVADNPIDI